MGPRSRRFRFEGQSLAFTDSGGGRDHGEADGHEATVIVLLHGLLLSRRMHEPLAAYLTARGHRVITLDLLGHGESSRPVDMTCYSVEQFAEQTLALIDHLGLDGVVLGGNSLGANVTLEVAARAPGRLAGMVVEMPVLDNALTATALTFVPLMLACTLATPVMRLAGLGARVIPHAITPFWVDVALDALRQDPAPSGALLQGVLLGRGAPHRNRRRTIDVPALVIGHRRDPIHPFSDADVLAGELPDARLVEASSMLELRLRPERLSAIIDGFARECRPPRPRARRPAAAR